MDTDLSEDFYIDVRLPLPGHTNFCYQEYLNILCPKLSLDLSLSYFILLFSKESPIS